MQSQNHEIYPFTALEVIENLTLALCKRYKLKEQAKVSKCRKFEDFILETVALVKFLKPKSLTENAWVLSWEGITDPMQTPTHSLLEFWDIFCFKNLSFQY